MPGRKKNRRFPEIVVISGASNQIANTRGLKNLLWHPKAIERLHELGAYVEYVPEHGQGQPISIRQWGEGRISAQLEQENLL